MKKIRKKKSNNNINNTKNSPNKINNGPKISQISNENIIINDNSDKENIKNIADPLIEELKLFYSKFLEANNLPIETKDKFIFIKKLISFYKKYKDDKENINKIFQFVTDAAKISKEEIKVILIIIQSYYLNLRILKIKKMVYFQVCQKHTINYHKF